MDIYRNKFAKTVTRVTVLFVFLSAFATPIKSFAQHSSLNDQRYYKPSTGRNWLTKIIGPSNTCIEIPNGENYNGAQLAITDCDFNNLPRPQRWIFLRKSLQIKAMGKCMAIKDNQKGSGVPLVIERCNKNRREQKWRVTTDGTIQTIDGRCVGTVGANASVGTLLQIENCRTIGNEKEEVPIDSQKWAPLIANKKFTCGRGLVNSIYVSFDLRTINDTTIENERMLTYVVNVRRRLFTEADGVTAWNDVKRCIENRKWGMPARNSFDSSEASLRYQTICHAANQLNTQQYNLEAYWLEGAGCHLP